MLYTVDWIAEIQIPSVALQFTACHAYLSWLISSEGIQVRYDKCDTISAYKVFTLLK